jgi:hypothetical protein
MNGPNDLDDGWAELARELGLEGDRPSPTPEPDHAAADLHPPEDPAPDGEDEFVELPGEAPTDADVYAEGDPEGEPDDGEAEGDTDDGEDAEGEGESTGEPGEPKKKRRRRRRRKKKPGEVATAPPAEGELPDESDEDTESDESDEPPAADTLEEEGATPAATRELIANWDVPSWETIVTTMLFRPHGR